MPSYKQEEPKSSGAFFVEPGIYQVEIANAVEKLSAERQRDDQGDHKGRASKRRRRAGDSRSSCVYRESFSWKIDQFLASIGQAVIPGEEVSIDADDLVGATGLAMLGEEPGQKNPDHRFNTLERWIFGDERSEWLAKNGKAGAAVKREKKKEDSDSIPF
jgi:hypothetical protein